MNFTLGLGGKLENKSIKKSGKIETIMVEGRKLNTMVIGKEEKFTGEASLEPMIE